ncbi:MAG: AAA family ATPase, partial [Deltaproteobacteria bacterium]|nr:AAA family ATPase [Deltaproteobacteria bacterium]
MRKEITKINQTFSEIISENMLYADKTEYIYNMVKKCKVCFLCRPRRFGKSLLLSTIEALFLGQRELFKGLWIDSSGFAFETHPVIYLSMDYDKTSQPDLLEKLIMLDLNELGTSEGLSITDLSLGAALKQLVTGLYIKYNKSQSTLAESSPNLGTARKVVVLIDEYDAPIIDNLDQPAIAEANLATLHDFYRGFKKLDKFIRFVFVTGISQAARVALGQSSNNIVDISLMSEFAGICGFTLQDLDALFADRYEDTLSVLIEKDMMPPNSTVADLKAEILKWYDGYVFDGQTQFDETSLDMATRVLNPFSIVNFFFYKSFSEYWLQSGPPTFLSKLIANDPDAFIFEEPLRDSEESLRSFIPGSVSPVPILFQTGYLTLNGVSWKDRKTPYSLKIPN